VEILEIVLRQMKHTKSIDAVGIVIEPLTAIMRGSMHVFAFKKSTT
jgi:hypothetical protein